MLESLIDNRGTILLFLGLVAAALGWLWWFQRRPTLLIAAGVLIALMLLTFVPSLFVESDAQQIERNLREVAASIETGKMDVLEKHLSKDFRYDSIDRDAILMATPVAVKRYKVTSVSLGSLTFDKLSRAERKATVSGNVTAESQSEGTVPMRCVIQLVLEDKHWRLIGAEFFHRIGGDAPIRIPLR